MLENDRDRIFPQTFEYVQLIDGKEAAPGSPSRSWLGLLKTLKRSSWGTSKIIQNHLFYSSKTRSSGAFEFRKFGTPYFLDIFLDLCLPSSARRSTRSLCSISGGAQVSRPMIVLPSLPLYVSEIVWNGRLTPKINGNLDGANDKWMEFEVNTLFVHKPIRSCWCFCNAPPFRWLWYLHSWSQVRQKKILFGDLLQRVDKHLEQFDVVPRRLWVWGMGSLQIDVENRLIWRQTRENYFCIVIMSSLCNCRIDFMRLCSVCVRIPGSTDWSPVRTCAKTVWNCWFLFLFNAVPCFHSRSFEFCWFDLFDLFDLNSDFEEHSLWNQLQVSKPVQSVCPPFTHLYVYIYIY